jgi:hypothetical protein
MGTASAISALITALILLALLRRRQLLKRKPMPPAGKPPKEAFVTYESMVSGSVNDDVEAVVTTSNPLFAKKNVTPRK